MKSLILAAITVAIALVVTSVSAPFAAATPQYKYYSASEAPSPIYVGTPSQVAVTLTNSSSSNQPFASAELTLGNLPSSAVAIVSNSGGWSATFAGTNPAVVLLESGSLPGVAPGGTLTVNLTLTPPTAASIPVGTVVKQSNNFSGTGNNFNLNGTDPTIAVIPVTLAFQQQPSDVQQSTKSQVSYMCPPVSVLVTAGGHPVGGVSVTLAPAGPDPGLTSGSTTTATSDSTSGLATFGTMSGSTCTSGLAATNLGSGYAFSASSLSAGSSVTSDSFSVVQSAQICTATPCSSPTLKSPSTGTTGTITSSFGSPGYEQVGSFAQGGLSCDSLVTTTAGDPLVAETPGVGASGTLTMTFPKAVVNSLANNGTPLMPVCAGAKKPFPVLTSTPGSAAYPYQGLLPDCPTDYLTPPTTGIELCVLSRSKNAAAETIVIYASNLSDPSFW